MDMQLPQVTQQLLDAINTGMVLVDNDFKVLHMNTAAELLLDNSRVMATGRIIFDAFPCLKNIAVPLQKAYNHQRTYSERDIALQNGKQHHVIMDCLISPMVNHQLETEYLILELHQVDRRLRISREDHLLSQGEGTRGLLRGVAHEIKNPLGGIRGAAQLLAAELPDDSFQEYTDVITQEVDRLQNLLDRMLGPRQLPRLSEINIHQVLEQVRKLVSAELSDQATLEFDYDPSLPDVYADQDMLQQAMLNLVRNAVQATTHLQTGKVLIRTRPERQFTIGPTKHRLLIKIEIIDNGEGISPEMQETMFLPMITGKKDGSGLGLPIAQTLVQRHGGLIEYEPYDDKTCFTVYLPIGHLDEKGK